VAQVCAQFRADPPQVLRRVHGTGVDVHHVGNFLPNNRPFEHFLETRPIFFIKTKRRPIT
jgi:hypothetical protein